MTAGVQRRQWSVAAAGRGLILQQIGEDEVVRGRQVLASKPGGQRGITAFDCGKDAQMFGRQVLGLTDDLKVDIQIAVGETSEAFDELDQSVSRSAWIFGDDPR